MRVSNQITRNLPEWTVDYIMLRRARKRFPHCDLRTHHVGETARLGVGCRILRGAEIGNHVEIGRYSYINTGSVIASGSIGSFCSVGYYCQIGMHEHPIDYVTTSPRIYGSQNILGMKPLWKELTAPPSIGNDVWIGSLVAVMQGVKIGDGAIVAAGAVVTRDVPPYTVVAGVPARQIRRRFNEDIVKWLKDLRWWDLPLEELHSLRWLFAAGRAELAYDAWRDRAP